MKNTEILNRIEANEVELNNLFRKFNIQGRGIQGIREGHNKNGNAFIGIVADILNNKKASGSRSNFDDETTTLGPDPYDYGTGDSEKKLNIWESLNNILGFVDSASDSIYKLRTSIKGEVAKPINAGDYITAEKGKTNWFLIGAGIAVVVILILIFKK